MKSQYLELKAIADNMQRLAQEAFNREKQEAIDWILDQISLFGISFENLEIIVVLNESLGKEVTPSLPTWNFADTKTNAFLKARNISKHFLLIEGKGYKSYVEASKELGIHRDTIKSRCISGSSRFENWIVSLQKSKNFHKQAIRIDGKDYDSYSQASRALGISKETIYGRCNKNIGIKFRDWLVLSKDTGQPIAKPFIARKSSTLLNGHSFKARKVESIKKQSEKMKGRRASEETREKMRLNAIMRLVPTSYGQPVRINGMNYSSISAASKLLNISTGTISYRCKNEHEALEEWMYLPLNTQILKQT